MKPSEYHSKLTCNRENIFAKNSYLSKSVLFELKDSTPKAWRDSPRQYASSDAITFGSAVDCKILTPDLFGEEFVVSPFDSFRSKEAREWKEDQASKGVTIISEERLFDIAKAKIAVADHPIAGPMLDLTRGKSQNIEIGEIRGVKFKCMMDFIEEGADYLTDLKTIRKVDKKTIEKHSFEFGYHVQAAIYRKLYNLNHPEDQRQGFRFVWVSSSAPFEVAVTEMPESDIQLGEAVAAELLAELIECTNSGNWPGPFNDEVAEIGLPSWAEGQIDEG